MDNFDVAIIGGGYSGIIAAIELKRRGISTCILEANDRIGKKILSTGNGKCNMSNVNVSKDNYNTDFVDEILKSSNDVVNKIATKYGILLRINEDRIYPYSESANTVLNILLEQLTNFKVHVLLNNKVTKIEKADSTFFITTQSKKIIARNVILSTGSNAGFGTNSHFLLEPFGHKTTPLYQTLVPIKQTRITGANGVRAQVEMRLFIDNKFVHKESGEVLFKDGFISGILTFRMSSYISRALVKKANSTSFIIIDFVPDMSENALKDFISTSKLKDPLTGILHKALIRNFDGSSNIVHDLKNCKMMVEGLGQVQNSQVLSGGLDVSQFDNKTLESKLCKNLYAAGEVLNVDGECGGYNLHWALCSALAIVKAIQK